LVACNNSRPAADTGISLADVGGGGHDAGTPGHDAAMTGPCSLTVTAASIGSLMGGCFPRCSAATVTAINACPATDDGTCLNAALMSDTTPGIAWTQNGTAATAMLDCGTCFGVQQLHCITANGCNNEVTAYLTCRRSATPAPPCTTEDMAITTCANDAAHNPAIRACLMDGTMGVQACFGG
jgi:hypothetical protein